MSNTSASDLAAKDPQSALHASGAPQCTSWPAQDFLRILHLRGTPEHRGALHGHLMRQEIATAVDVCVSRLLGPALQLPEADLCRAAMCQFTHSAPWVQSEIVALSAAADCPLARVALLCFVDDLWEQFGCTALALPAHNAFAHCTDLLATVPTDTALVMVVEPESQLAHLLLGWPGVIGAYAGMNVAGVAVALNLAEVDAPARGFIPGTVPATKHLVCDVLATATSAMEACQLLTEEPRSVAFVGCVADPEAVYTVESGGRLPPYSKREHEPFCAGNLFISPQRRALQPTDWLLQSELYLNGAKRAMEQMLADSEGAIDSPLRALTEFLCSPDVLREVPSGLVSSRAAVFEPRHLRVWVADGGPGGIRRGFTPLSLKKLLVGEPGLQLRARHPVPALAHRADNAAS